MSDENKMKVKNQIDEYYGYNDTVSAMISKMCLEAYNIFDIEKEGVDQKTAIARAIGDTFKKNIEILTQSYSMDRQMIDHGINKDKGYVEHLEKITFMKFAESLYESGNYRVKKRDSFYELSFIYQLGVFKIGELRKINKGEVE